MHLLHPSKNKNMMRILSVFLLMMLFAFTNDVHGMSMDTYAAHIDNSRQNYQVYNRSMGSSHVRPVSANTSQDSRIETFVITSPQLGNRQKNIQVYLPLGYDASDSSYPVFYLHDGAYLFNPPREGYGDYAIDETIDRLTTEGIIEGVIVVGIEHDYDYQWDEYTPWINENMHDWIKPQNGDPIEGGEGFLFLDFIVSTLKPEIDSRYRTRTDRENTAVGGFCRGGVFPLLAGLTHPEVFSMTMSMSPTVWLAEGGGPWLSNNQLINHINSIAIPADVRFYIDIGTEESSGSRLSVRDRDGNRMTYPQAYIEGAEAVYATLLNKGVPESNIYFKIFEGSAGGRDVWGGRFDTALLWLMNQESIEDQETTAEPRIEDIQKDEQLEPPQDDNQENTLIPPRIDIPDPPPNLLDTLTTPAIIIGGSLLMISLVLVIWLLGRRKT